MSTVPLVSSVASPTISTRFVPVPTVWDHVVEAALLAVWVATVSKAMAAVEELTLNAVAMTAASGAKR